MADIIHYLTNSANLDSIPVATGNLIFCEDSKKVYFDGASGRVCYDSIIIFETEEQRLDCLTPFESFYYVQDSNMLWRYDEYGWHCLTESFSQNVEFIDKEYLPEEGEYEILYVCGDEEYVWQDGHYVQMTADSKWREV